MNQIKVAIINLKNFTIIKIIKKRNKICIINKKITVTKATNRKVIKTKLITITNKQQLNTFQITHGKESHLHSST